jgi:hypothetical protein
MTGGALHAEWLCFTALVVADGARKAGGLAHDVGVLAREAALAHTKCLLVREGPRGALDATCLAVGVLVLACDALFT